MVKLLTNKDDVLKNLKIYEMETVQNPEKINALLKPNYLSVNMDTLSVTVEYKVEPWMSNRGGFLHGGLIATMLDHVAGITLSSFVGYFCPSTNINCTYVHSALISETVSVTGTILSAGSKLIHTEAKMYNKQNGLMIASAALTFFNKGHDASMSK